MKTWGTGYKEKNQFQEYFCEIVTLSKDEDWMGIQELIDELTPEQGMDIWFHLASYTRKSLKGHVTLQAP